jgi:hypothetical protein
MAQSTASGRLPATTGTRRAPRAGLRREIGFIGLLWASGGSIIGSGWLFGAQGALATAGPAAVISWGIGALAILLLALVHAELGAMYPVAGGTARFPHYAFGGAAGASFGWFSWLQAATVAPIEVMAVIQYGQHYSFANDLMKVSGGENVLTAKGVVAAVALMAIFTTINFLSVRKLAHTNSTATWWKVGVPLLTIVVLAIVSFHPGNFGAADGFAPSRASGILGAVSTSGIIFALLGFEQADQLAGESANPKRDIPPRGCGRDRDRRGPLHPAPGRVPGGASRLPDRCDVGGLPVHHLRRPVRAARHAGRRRLAGQHPLPRRGDLAGRDRPSSTRRPPRGCLVASAATATCPASTGAPTAAASRGSAS